MSALSRILSILYCITLSACSTVSDLARPPRVALAGDGRMLDDANHPTRAGWGPALINQLRPEARGTFRGAKTASQLQEAGLDTILAEKPTHLVIGLGQGDADAQTPVPLFEDTLRQIVATCTTRQVSPVFVTPPVLRTVDPVTAKTNVPPPADAQPYADVIARVARQTGAHLVDLRSAMQDTYREIGDRACWFLHPPLDASREPVSNIRTNKQWRSPTPRQPAYFSDTGADTLAQWIATLLRRDGAALASALCPVDGPPTNDYHLVWRDEFEGAHYDTNNWSCRNPGKRKDGFNNPACLRLDGQGHLVIDIKKIGDEFHAGMIATEGKRAWKYGYFECRATLPQDQGFWNAFWFMGPRVGAPQSGKGKVDDTFNNGTEIDVMEYLRSQGDVVHLNLHWNGYGDDHKSSPYDVFVPDLRRNPWHVFGVEWRPDGYTFYVDGRRAWETQDAISRTEEHIILSVEIGKWAGDIAKAQLPQDVKFDWVRVWQKPATGSP